MNAQGLLLVCAIALVAVVGVVAFTRSSGDLRCSDALAQPTTIPVVQKEGNPCILQEGEQDDTYASFPSVAPTAQGGVIAAWRHSTGHQDSTADIMFAQHGGVGSCGWTVPRSIAREANSDCTLSIGGLVSDDNVVVAGIVRYRALSSVSARDFRAHAVRSTDGGVTWGAVSPVDLGFDGHSYPASLAVMSDGSMLMAAYGTDDPEEYKRGWYVRFARSTDQGERWKPYGPSLRTPSGWAEPQLFLDGEQLFMTLRYEGGELGKPGAFLAQSSNNGQDWTEPRRITSNTSGQPTIGKLHDGRYMLVYRDLAATDHPFRYATSLDLRTWQVGQNLTQGGKGRMLYAGFAPIDSNSTSVVYSLENPGGNPTSWANLYTTTITSTSE